MGRMHNVNNWGEMENIVEKEPVLPGIKAGFHPNAFPRSETFLSFLPWNELGR